jgi:hypothetical protein
MIQGATPSVAPCLRAIIRGSNADDAWGGHELSASPIADSA